MALYDNIRNEPEFNEIIKELEAKYQKQHKRRNCSWYPKPHTFKPIMLPNMCSWQWTNSTSSLVNIYSDESPFDYAQGDSQTERSPRLTSRAGKSFLWIKWYWNLICESVAFVFLNFTKCTLKISELALTIPWPWNWLIHLISARIVAHDF